MTTTEKVSRKDQILQTLVHMLETQPGARITTANLAREVGVSEAALYRHFPSKARMFEGLMSYIEEVVFSRVKMILQDFESAEERCQHIMTLVLTFAEKNPGMSCLMSGDALAGETERLRSRMQQLFERLETQIKQVLREAEIREGLLPTQTVTAEANLLVSILEGRIRQYVRSEFDRKPTENWQDQWAMLSPALLRPRQEN
ncbi:MAG: nucleoid occlusion factor SlmA [Oceanobacter sp.]